MEVVKVLQKGQMVIPKPVRTELHIEPGKKLIIEATENGFFAFPEPKDPLRAMTGLFAPFKDGSAVETVRKFRRESDRRLR